MPLQPMLVLSVFPTPSGDQVSELENNNTCFLLPETLNAEINGTEFFFPTIVASTAHHETSTPVLANRG